MIVNHKDAIAFLVSAADEIGFNRYTILNLHGILAQSLLPDEAAAGCLRHIGVGIEKSTFHPLELPQLIEGCFNQLLATAAAIENPFEQALFVMAQLPYLQPFDDINKCVSRLAANIPFIKHNLWPLSFTDVPRALYTEACALGYLVSPLRGGCGAWVNRNASKKSQALTAAGKQSHELSAGDFRIGLKLLHASGNRVNQ